MDEGVDLFGEPFYAAQQRLSTWQRKMQELDWWTPMSAMLLPALSRAGDAVTSAEARKVTSIVALALERHRLAKGSYPDALEELVPSLLPELPPDPFTGQPLLYVNTGDRVVVYSVGANLTDDGGVEPAPGTRSFPSSGDVVFTLKEPAKVADESEEAGVDE
jgi:hypothetical protein